MKTPDELRDLAAQFRVVTTQFPKRKIAMGLELHDEAGIVRRRLADGLDHTRGNPDLIPYLLDLLDAYLVMQSTLDWGRTDDFRIYAAQALFHGERTNQD